MLPPLELHLLYRFPGHRVQLWLLSAFSGSSDAVSWSTSSEVSCVFCFAPLLCLQPAIVLNPASFQSMKLPCRSDIVSRFSPQSLGKLHGELREIDWQEESKVPLHHCSHCATFYP